MPDLRKVPASLLTISSQRWKTVKSSRVVLTWTGGKCPGEQISMIKGITCTIATMVKIHLFTNVLITYTFLSGFTYLHRTFLSTFNKYLLNSYSALGVGGTGVKKVKSLF